MSTNVGLGGLGVGSDLGISWVSIHFCLWGLWMLLSSALSWLSQPDQHSDTRHMLFPLALFPLQSRPSRLS